VKPRTKCEWWGQRNKRIRLNVNKKKKDKLERKTKEEETSCVLAFFRPRGHSQGSAVKKPRTEDTKTPGKIKKRKLMGEKILGKRGTKR